MRDTPLRPGEGVARQMMSLQTATIDQVLRLVGGHLEAQCRSVDGNHSCDEGGTPAGCPYLAPAPPPIGIQAYLARIVHYADPGTEGLLSSVIYIRRMLEVSVSAV